MNASGNLPSFSGTIRGLRIGTQVWTATSRVRTADGDPPRDDLIEKASCARKFLPFFRADTLDLRAISRRVEKRPQLRRRWRSLPQRHRPSHLMLSIRPASRSRAAPRAFCWDCKCEGHLKWLRPLSHLEHGRTFQC